MKAENIKQCMIRDRHRLRKSLAREREMARAGADVSKAREKIDLAIAASLRAVQKRKANRPALSYPESLPVSAKADEIIALIDQHQVLIVAGETGSGKSTQLPKLCLAAGQGIYGKIAHTQPRRIAARAIASRLTQELNLDMAAGVGYRIRFEEKCSDEDYIRVLTDGMLLAEAQSDAFLNEYDTIIVDEAHERSLNIDFLLGSLKQLLKKRKDLKLIITSATIDTDKFSKHFGNAPIVNVSGRNYPVELHYQAPEDEKTRSDAQTNKAIMQAIERLHKKRMGNTLVFLPGEREIREAQRFLIRHLRSGIDVLPLYARLASAEQAKLFRPSKRTRIILATNVAETSLTLPDIDYVVDVGLARISRYSPSRRVNTLPIERISKAAADQRKGRCGRVKNGVCIRLYSEEDFKTREDFTPPEIMRTALTGVVIALKSRRLGEPEDFGFIDLPKRNQFNAARQELKILALLDAQDNLTDIGKVVAKMPVDPRIGRMIYAAAYAENCLAEMIILAASLEIADPRIVPHDALQAARQHHKMQAGEQDDFFALIALFQSYQAQAKVLSRKALRNWCEKNYLAHARMREWQDLAKRLQREFSAVSGTKKMPNKKMPSKNMSSQDKNKQNKARQGNDTNKQDGIHRALLSGLLDQIAMKTDKGLYAGSYGKQLALFPGSSLAKTAPKWVMAAEMVETSQLFARTLAPIKVHWIETLAEDLIRREYAEPHWSKKAGHVLAFERGYFLGLPIYSGRRKQYGGIDAEEARAIFIREALLTGELNSHFDFITHNLAAVDTVLKLEHKIRRHDILVSDDVLADFYAQQLPNEVLSESSLRKWFNGLDAPGREKLLLSETTLSKRSLSQDEAALPDQLELDKHRIALDYHFSPGEEHDGISAHIPLPLLNQLSQADFDKLVPGYLNEKIDYLIRSLPKAARKALAPLPLTIDFAQAALSKDKRPLLLAMADILSERGMLKVSPQDFDTRRLPKHLSMNLVLLDEAGDEMAHAKTLHNLREQFGKQASDVIAEAENEWQQTGLLEWSFADLPQSIEVGTHDLKTQAYPAIVDAGQSVNLQLFDDPALAQLAHQAGVVRLMQIGTNFGKKLSKRTLPYWQDIALRYLPIASPEALRGALLDAVLHALIFESEAQPSPVLRKRADFEAQTQQIKTQFNQAIQTYAKALMQALTAYGNCANLLSERMEAGNAQLANSYDDIQTQMDYLIYEDFLIEVTLPELLRYPIYFKAIEMRISRLSFDAQGEAKKLALLAPYWTNYLQNWEAHPHNLELDKYRWLVEAYRVSIFAPSIKAPVPISPKRLDKAWASFLESSLTK